jgi:6-phosphogluconolactonase
MNLRIFNSAGDLAQGCARAIALQAHTARPFRIALSGGSTPRPVYDILGAPPLRGELEELDIDWILGDERCVPIEDPASNAGMIERTLFRHGMAARHSLLRFAVELGDPAAIATDFEQRWRTRAIGRLDLALQGIGQDGHTASLFPDTPVLAITDRIAHEVYVSGLKSWRVTLTLPVLQAARTIFVLAAGAPKRDVIAQVAAGGSRQPIAQVTAGHENVWWFIDRAAAPEGVPG